MSDKKRSWKEWWTEFYGLIFAWALILGFVGSLYLIHFMTYGFVLVPGAR